MGNKKSKRKINIKHFIKWIIIDSMLFWIFFTVPLVAYNIGWLIKSFYSSADRFLIMSYGIQLRAFCIVFRRINILLKTDDKYSGIKGLLKLW